MQPDFRFVDTDAELDDICASLSEKQLLGFDSEFVRTNTFFPKPGLYQLHDGEQACLLDPTRITQWQSFKSLLRGNHTTLVMHSCSEDLSLLQTALQLLPARLFDTQLAAAFSGLGFSTSYQELVRVELGIEIPKGETRSDWLYRPLSDSQLKYAVLDVTYLIELQERLTEKLVRAERLAWFESDSRELLIQAGVETGEASWEIAYKNLGAAWQLDEEALGILQKLCYWREMTAREKDKPRNWILKDQDLMGLASRLPATSVTSRDVEDSAVLPEKMARRQGRHIANFLNSEIAFAEPASPELLNRPLTGAGRKLLKQLQELSRRLAEDLNMSPELLSRRRLWVELLQNYYAASDNLWPPGLDNWRRELLESDVMKLLPAGAS